MKGDQERKGDRCENMRTSMSFELLCLKNTRNVWQELGGNLAWREGVWGVGGMTQLLDLLMKTYVHEIKVTC